MRFTKMHGAGNDYVYVNAFSETLPDDLPGLARAVSDRHTGVGGDGLILIRPSETADVRMQMFNADGSEAEMCGNGIRCVAKYVYDHDIARKETITAETGAGVLTLQIAETQNDRASQVRVNMGRPILEAAGIPTKLPGDPPQDVPLQAGGQEFPVTCVSMGNPHCVAFVDEVTDEWVLRIGPIVETHEMFPNRVNAEFVEVLSPREFNVRVWERGSGETQACGTGACAVAVAGVLTGRLERRVTGHLPGGDLLLEWSEEGDVYMTGPATEVFSGEWG